MQTYIFQGNEEADWSSEKIYSNMLDSFHSFPVPGSIIILRMKKNYFTLCSLVRVIWDRRWIKPGKWRKYRKKSKSLLVKVRRWKSMTCKILLSTVGWEEIMTTRWHVTSHVWLSEDGLNTILNLNYLTYYISIVVLCLWFFLLAL